MSYKYINTRVWHFIPSSLHHILLMQTFTSKHFSYGGSKHQDVPVCLFLVRSLRKPTW